MFQSLRFKMLAAMVLVIIVGVVITAFNANRSTTGEFQRYISHRQSLRLKRFGSLLTDFYAKSRSWNGVQPLINQLQAGSGERIVLADSNRKIIGDTDGRQMGTSAGTNWDYKILGPNGETAGFLFVNPPAETEISTSEYLLSVSNSVWVGALVAITIAFMTMLLISRSILHPIEDLTTAAKKMKKGDLSVRVKVATKDEIGQMGDSFNAMADSLAKQEQLRKNMVSDVAHELRTPLSNIRSFLEAARDGLIDPDLGLVENLYDEATLLNRLIDDLQELAQVESGRMRLELTIVNLGAVIKTNVDGMLPICQKKNLELSSEIPSDLPLVIADSHRVGQVLRNIICNATEYTPAGGKIFIVAHSEGAFVRVAVNDTGTGIALEHLPFLFERFYRADPSRTRSTGRSGLGLAIVKQLVQAQGGVVDVESTIGVGSTFSFTLPVHASIRKG